jgi:hypothetical protein
MQTVRRHRNGKNKLQCSYAMQISSASGVSALIHIGPHDLVLICKQKIRDIIKAMDSLLDPDRIPVLVSDLSGLMDEHLRLTGKPYLLM